MSDDAERTVSQPATDEQTANEEQPEVSGHVDFITAGELAKGDHLNRLAEADRARRAAEGRTSPTRDGGLLDKIRRHRER